MACVPGSRSELLAQRAAGVDVRIVCSPLDEDAGAMGLSDAVEAAVEPDALRFCFEVAASGTVAQGRAARVG